MKVGLETLYPPVHNLRGLTHPLWQRQFSYLTDEQLFPMAESAVDKIIRSGLQQIIVAETGASPYAEICERIAILKGHTLKWRRVKFQREPGESIFPTLASFLTSAEAQEQIIVESQFVGPYRQLSRVDALREICKHMPFDLFKNDPPNILALLDGIASDAPNEFQTATAAVFAGTKFADLLSAPFVYFDEYIDSGTTFRNALTFFRCFVNATDLRTLSYYISPPAAKAHPRVLHTEFTSADKPDCFATGAYPYENRIDLIGHYYFINSSTFQRVELKELIEHFFPNETQAAGRGSSHKEPKNSAEQSTTAFLEAVYRFAQHCSLLPYVRSKFTEKQVHGYIGISDTVRYCLYHFEQACGRPDTAEFLFQLFDMYGPAWTPMPVSFHFDFWNGFGHLPSYIEEQQEFRALLDAYAHCRAALLSGSAEICIRRRNAWLTNIHTNLEKRYGQQHERHTGKDPSFCINERKSHRHFHGTKRKDSRVDSRPST